MYILQYVRDGGQSPSNEVYWHHPALSAGHAAEEGRGFTWRRRPGRSIPASRNSLIQSITDTSGESPITGQPKRVVTQHKVSRKLVKINCHKMDVSNRIS